MSTVTIEPVTEARLSDLADLFGTNNATKGCWCTWPLIPRPECRQGWNNGGNRRRFEAFAARARPPAGLLAMMDGRAVGWCATGPRSRYPTTIGPRTKILAGRDPREDDDVWLVPCFFVRVGYRRAGITYALLREAVSMAEQAGATAIEGFPIAGAERGVDRYLGREVVFERCGFECIARPSPRRAVMRRDLR